jgi:hypothetical protein
MWPRHTPSRTPAKVLLSHFASLARSLFETPAIWPTAFLQREQGIQIKPFVACRHGSLHNSQIPTTKPQCCMEFHSLAERTLFAINMHRAHASTGVEPMPHRRLTVLAISQVDYQTALSAWWAYISEITLSDVQNRGALYYIRDAYFEWAYIFQK